PMLVDPALAPLTGFAWFRATDLVQESGDRQSVQRLPDLELDQSRIIDERLHIAPSVHQLEHHLLLPGEIGLAVGDMRTIDGKDRIHARYILRDLRPLDHTPRAIKQERLGPDGH